MREVCLRAVHELARRDDRVVFIGSDITKRNLEGFAEEFPERFFIEGIYEGHIIGMAAGLAMEGKIPYVNTIASFLTRRCYEQILIDLCLHRLPVRLLGSGGGAVYAPLGPTHLATEDISILRAIPNMTIVAPCDADEMKRLMPRTLDWPGPVYIRLAKGKDKIVSSGARAFEIGKAVPMRSGNDVLFVTTGITAQVALDAAERLAGQGIESGVLHVHTVKPLDGDAVLCAARKVKLILSVEENTVVGGLGGAIAELLMESGLGGNTRFARIGFPDVFASELGSQSEIMNKYGMTGEKLAQRAVELLRK